MFNKIALTFVVAGLVVCTGCKRDSGAQKKQADTASATTVSGDHSGREHAQGDDHAGQDNHAAGGGHAHEETDLGTVNIYGMKVAFAQGHGKLVAGKEGHLVVKLPYNDQGSTVIRAWIGGEDRTLSFVGKGQYAPSHDDYDVHAITPDPLSEDALWWVEIEKPDGTTVVGSVKPL